MTAVDFLALTLVTPRRDCIRAGQHFWNCLFKERQALANHLCNTPDDPFYNDAKLPAAIDWAIQHWSDRP